MRLTECAEYYGPDRASKPKTPFASAFEKENWLFVGHPKDGERSPGLFTES
jgi:hypothetical protein